MALATGANRERRSGEQDDLDDESDDDDRDQLTHVGRT
jgi:hypothetical protein